MVWSDIDFLYTEMHTRDRYHELKQSMIHPNGKTFPQLKGRGPQVKQLGPVLIKVFEKNMVAEDAVQQLALWGLKCSVRIDEVLDANQGLFVLPLAAAKEVEDMCFEFCRVNATLVLTFHRATPSVALFNCTMKNHYLMHVGVAARYINPLIGSC